MHKRQGQLGTRQRQLGYRPVALAIVQQSHERCRAASGKQARRALPHCDSHPGAQAQGPRLPCIDATGQDSRKGCGAAGEAAAAAAATGRRSTRAPAACRLPAAGTTVPRRALTEV